MIFLIAFLVFLSTSLACLSENKTNCDMYYQICSTQNQTCDCFEQLVTCFDNLKCIDNDTSILLTNECEKYSCRSNCIFGMSKNMKLIFSLPMIVVDYSIAYIFYYWLFDIQ